MKHENENMKAYMRNEDMKGDMKVDMKENMKSVPPKPAHEKHVRSAEAARTATCAFADRLATAAIAAYRTHRPAQVVYQQTVLAAFIIQRGVVSVGSGGVDSVDSGVGSVGCATSGVESGGKVVSVGGGVGRVAMQDGSGVDDNVGYCDLCHDDSNDDGLNALNAQLNDLKVVSFGVGTKVLPMNLNIEKGSNGEDVHYKSLRRIRDCHAEVLARRGLIKYLFGEVKLALSNATASESVLEACESGMLKLRDGYGLHFYSSSQPCGNATIKKWAKSSNPNYKQGYLRTFPLQLTAHPRFFPTAIPEGETAVMVKRNGVNETHSGGVSLNRTKSNFPVGTAAVSSGEGDVLTCSDKIAKWNAVGVQGNLLSNFVLPIYLSSICIGRKFSQRHCERALCCRIQDFYFCFPYDDHVAEGAASLSASAGPSSTKRACWRIEYSTHHPAMLSTAVKFDTSSIVTNLAGPGLANNTSASNNGDEPGAVPSGELGVTKPRCGAVFDERRCLCWWVNGPFVESVVEIVDGSTGLKVVLENSEGASSLQQESIISSKHMLEEFSNFNRSLSVTAGSGSLSNKGAGTSKIFSVAGQMYRHAKQSLLSREFCFGEWGTFRSTPKLT
jgi:hypothetical protein